MKREVGSIGGGMSARGFGVTFEKKVFRLYKQPITLGSSGFPRSYQVSFSLK